MGPREIKPDGIVQVGPKREVRFRVPKDAVLPVAGDLVSIVLKEGIYCGTVRVNNVSEGRWVKSERVL